MRHHALATMLLVSGCSRSPQPHDTGLAGHERAAREHESAADEIVRACDQRHTEPAMMRAAPCWTTRNDRLVRSHRDAAAQHRAASAALRDAEATACAGISDDRDVSPFEHRDDIARVESLTEPTSQGKAGSVSRNAGATVAVRALPGLTSEWLQRIVDCHLARNAALGHVVPEMPDCPLVPRGVEARVRPAGNGFAVDIRADDPDSAREILDRARRLIARPTASGR